MPIVYPCDLIDHVQRHDDAWVCRRIDIARHRHEEHPCRGGPA